MIQMQAETVETRDFVLERLPFGTAVDKVIAVLHRDGALVLTGMLGAEQVAKINAELDVYMNPLELGNFGNSEGSFGGGKTTLGLFMGERTKRMQHCLKYSETYRTAYLDNDQLHAYISAAIPARPGTHALHSSQAIEIGPGETAQPLHRDAASMMRTLGINHAGSAELLVNSILALTDVTEEMGATRVIPGSHLWDDFDRVASPSETIAGTMNAGDVLLFSGKLIHGGGANVTKDRHRRVLSTTYGVPLLKTEEAYPFVITVEEARTYPARVQGNIGFRSSPQGPEYPGFLCRANNLPLEVYLGFEDAVADA